MSSALNPISGVSQAAGDATARLTKATKSLDFSGDENVQRYLKQGLLQQSEVDAITSGAMAPYVGGEDIQDETLNPGTETERMVTHNPVKTMDVTQMEAAGTAAKASIYDLLRKKQAANKGANDFAKQYNDYISILKSNKDLMRQRGLLEENLQEKKMLDLTIS
ncbi:MAG: hypothetical protein IPL34_20495 [Thiofilum sp.]|uniref:hypothetical protein n=1 Tax=Thiofilum sp. TaxID=2212733 RepID=UPI0025D2BE35|nr:hypothetical protein [Thiofilum sp.]MBK8455663.1 hypothetical protein [Thiofilum sp.]